MNKLKILLPLFIFLLAACAEKNTNLGRRTVVKPSYAKVNFPQNNELKEINYLERLSPASEYFYISSGFDTTIEGKNGTRVSINANCLADKNGNPVSGLIRIELKELYSKSDLILANKPTVSNRQMLVSAGSLYINATSGKENLRILCPEGITIAVPAKMDNSSMDLFLGEMSKKGNINWVQDSMLNEISMDQNYSLENFEIYKGLAYEDPYNLEQNYLYNEVEKYLFTTGKFGWINCDRFYEDQREKVNMVVKLRESLPAPYKTNMYIVFKNINSVMQLYSSDNTDYQSTDLPKGEEVFLITVSANENKNFFSIESVVIDDKEIIPAVSLKEATKKEIEEKLKSIN